MHRARGGPRSSVYAYRHELDAWLQGERSSLTKAAEPRRTGRKALWIISALMLGALLIATVMLVIRGLHSRIPANFTIAGSSLIILDKSRRPLWKYDTGLETLSSENFYRDHFQERRMFGRQRALPNLLIRDIDGDGQKEVLFAVCTIDEHACGRLVCFSAEGKTRWSFSAGRQAVFGTTTYSAEYRIYGIESADLDGDKIEEIVLIATNVSLFPTRLVVLRADGSVVGQYWHSGHLGDMLVRDINGDGIKEIIAVGTNNEYRRGCLVVFNPMALSGCSPQSNEYYTFRGGRPGSQLHYLLFPRSPIDQILNPVNEAIGRVDVLANDVIEAEATISGIIYQFDSRLRLQGAFTSDFSEMQSLKAHGANGEPLVLTAGALEKLGREILRWGGRSFSAN